MNTTTTQTTTEHYAVTTLRHRIAVLSRGITRALANGQTDRAELLRLIAADRRDDLAVAIAEHTPVAR